MKTLRAAVVGVGYLGHFHAQKYKSIPGVELVGVFDQNQAIRQEVATKLGVRAFANLEDLVGNVDLATISTSTPSHFIVSEFLLKKGIHLLVEKPLTLDSESAGQLVQLATQQKLVLAAGHIERFNPVFEAFFAEFKVAHLADMHIFATRVNPFKVRGSDVSVLHDLMIHDLDLLLALHPGSLTKVHGRAGIAKSKYLDWASVGLEFSSGMTAQLEVSRVANQQAREWQVFQGKEKIWHLGLGANEISWAALTFQEKETLLYDKKAFEKYDGLLKETENFVSAVRGETTLRVSGQSGKEAIGLMESIIEKVRGI